MLTQKIVVTTQVLKKQRQSIKTISRKMVIPRNTVKKFLDHGNLVPQYQLTNTKPKELEHYKGYIHRYTQSATK